MQYISFELVESTQLWSIENFHTLDLSTITCVHAKQQRGGIGTKGRSWSSPLGGLYATFVFALPRSRLALNLAQVISLSLLNVLKELPLQLKWANDVMYNQKKLAGALCHIKDQVAILGVGVNVNIDDLGKIDQPATSLKIETGKIWAIESLLQSLAEQFEKDWLLYSAEGFAPFYQSYCQAMPYLGSEITWNGSRGTAVRICEDGRLEVKVNGKHLVISEGSFVKG